ncbi:SUMF1/EgtB/PvdO family nonheme iron enzyme [Undibacterium arcticum]
MKKWAHATYVPAFGIDSTLVSNAQFAEFVADGGYQRVQFWSPAGRTWLMQQERSAPRYWERDAQGWNIARFGRRAALPQREPVRHISLFEAQAYCVWLGRRLPTEAEWEWAATSGHAAFRWGDLWEWTASRFEPYPGFSADAYREYSAPWFSSHQVLRGASFATQGRMRTPRYRNFFICRSATICFVGFRTCAL